MALPGVVALALVDLREKSGLEPHAPAEASDLPDSELRVMCHQRWHPLATVRGVYRALAAPGGQLGRMGDSLPGWQPLWLGRRSLRLLVEGVQVAAHQRDH